MSIFIAGKTKKFLTLGSVKNCGKTSTSLSLLNYFIEDLKLSPSDIGYIKPCTQCTNPTIVWKFCEKHGIKYVGIGPVVYYNGFTSECVEGKHDSKELLQKIKDEVENLKKGRKFVIVDGVGYPSVGSICGISNAHVAQILKIPVLIVSLMKDGSLGNTIDNFNQNLEYFKSFGVNVIGTICNKVPESHFERCEKYVKMYFENRKEKVFGFVKYHDQVQEDEVEHGCKYVKKKDFNIITEKDEFLMKEIFKSFSNVDFKGILERIQN